MSKISREMIDKYEYIEYERENNDRKIYNLNIIEEMTIRNYTNNAHITTITEQKDKEIFYSTKALILKKLYKERKKLNTRAYRIRKKIKESLECKNS